MLLKKCLAALMALVLLIGAVPALAEYDKPYYIEVDVTNQIVTVYNTSDGSIARQMLCSTGTTGHETIEGVYYLPAIDRSDERSEWYSFYALGVYAKWATRIEGPYLFHSIPCYSKSEADVVPRYVREFGMAASHGCIRLRVPDAEFIAKNCLRGTRVHIFRSGELQEDLRQLLYISSYTGEDGMTYQEFMGISDDSLGRGSSGTEVLDLQYRLADLGYYDGEMTSAYDNDTIAAVKNLQKDLGVSDTGIASDSLLQIIYSDDAPVAMGQITIKEGKSGPVVKKLQSALQEMGLYNGELDSIMDLEVTEAIQKFQTACGYTADGVATAEMQKAIYYQLGQLEETFGEGTIPSVEMVTEEITKAKLDASANIIIRAEESTESERVGKIEIGKTMTVLDVGDKWAKIYYDGKTGYIYKKYLKEADPEYNYILRYTADDGTVYTIGHTLEDYLKGAKSMASEMKDILASVSDEVDEEDVVNYVTVNTGADNVNLNLRADADSSSDVLAEIPNGTSLRAVSSDGEWTKVGYDNHIGYLMNQYLTFWEGDSESLTQETVTLDQLDDLAGILASMGGSVYATVVDPEGSEDDRKMRPYLYKEADTSSDRYTLMAESVEVEIVEVVHNEKRDQDWLKVNYMGQTGYMRDICLQLEVEGA